jgi:Uma2 family endonuclease
MPLWGVGLLQTQTIAENRTSLSNVRWETFIELAEQRRGSIPRMTFSEGVLELLSPLRQHENIGRLIGRMVETYTEELEIEIHSVASTTFKRKDLQRAFEADESYYIQHADMMRAKEHTDLTIDPPPDLVIEVEITSSLIEKVELFATIGVPELWRHDGESLRMYTLVANRYQLIESSLALSGLTSQKLNLFLDKRFETGETAIIREFRQSLIHNS